MRKLILWVDDDDPYSDELSCAVERINGEALRTDLEDLSVDFLTKNKIDVVISTALPKQWYYTLRGMNIVSITLGERDLYYDLADIVIDCKNDNPKRYFVSHEHTICNNPDFEFDEISELIKKLEWDSEFFGFNIAYLSCMHLTDNIYQRIERFIREERIRLVEYLCNCHDARSVRVAEDKGFRFTDIRFQFVRNLTDVPEVELPDGLRFGMADATHINQLREIADGIYLDSRYYFDNGFEKARVIEFYKNWVEKGVRGQFDHECWCLFSGDSPEAFCTTRYGKGITAVIGLVGLSRRLQGKGLGTQLLYRVLGMMRARGFEKVTVVTQGRNYGAQNLYQSVGFKTKVTQLWYHKWVY